MYANVILDRVSDALDHVFTYAVPEGTDAREVPLCGKREVAEAILDRVAELF